MTFHRFASLAAQASFAVSLCAISACSSTTKSTTDAATTPDAAISDTPAATTLNGCSTFEDDSAATATRTIQWGFTVMSTPSHCMKIAAGQSVQWTSAATAPGLFTTHPLVSHLGDTPNPIDGTDESGPSATVTFATPGTYGYWCQVHTSMMMGVIEVVAAE